MTADTLLPALTASARHAVHPATDTGCSCATEDALLADRDDGTVVRHGDTVAKAHAPDTDPRPSPAACPWPRTSPASSCLPWTAPPQPSSAAR